MEQRGRMKLWCLYALLWLALALCFSSQAYLEYEIRGNQASWLAMFVWEGTGWAIWSGLALLMYRFSQRLPLDREGWARRLPLYLAAAGILVPAQLLLHVALNRAAMHFLFRPYGSFLEDLGANVFSRVTWRVFVFSIIVLGCHGWLAQRKFRMEERKAAELEVQLMRAQLEALRMQMHPHFLFNTLHSLAELIHRDVRAAEEVVVLLGDFLRLALRDPGSLQVPLRKEMEFLDCYLQIEKIRLQERLQVSLEIDPSCLDVPVPHLILQPIVENAIRHGITPRSANGKLEIQAAKVDSMLRIEVRDNGPGLSGEAPESYFQKGLGLSNTHARLEKMYGAARLSLHDAVNGGLVVRMEIPAGPQRLELP